MQLTRLAVAAALALSSAAVFAEVSPLDLSSGSVGFSNTPASGGFMDGYTFALAQTSSFSASITSVVNGAKDLDFTSITLTGPAGLYSFTKLLGNPVEVWSLSTDLLSAGSYSLTLLGVNSVSGASYGGNAAVSVVPEPESYALMFAGLGAVGFLASRRKRRS